MSQITIPLEEENRIRWVLAVRNELGDRGWSAWHARFECGDAKLQLARAERSLLLFVTEVMHLMTKRELRGDRRVCVFLADEIRKGGNVGATERVLHRITEAQPDLSSND